MKKLLALMLLFTTVTAFAGIDYGLEKGQTRAGIYGGMSVPQDWSIDGVNVAPGDTGFIFGGEIIHNITPMFGLGLDLGYASYGSKTTLGVLDMNASVFSISAVGRVNFMPQSQGRIYIPFGVGLSHLSSTIAETTPGLTQNGTDSQSGPSFLAGLGFEFDLNPEWTLGIEGRYFYMPVDDNKFGDSKFSSINILLKLGVRF